MQGNKYPTVTSYKERLIKLNLLSLQYNAETRKDLIWAYSIELSDYVLQRTASRYDLRGIILASLNAELIISITLTFPEVELTWVHQTDLFCRVYTRHVK